MLGAAPLAGLRMLWAAVWLETPMGDSSVGAARCQWGKREGECWARDGAEEPLTDIHRPAPSPRAR